MDEGHVAIDAVPSPGDKPAKFVRSKLGCLTCRKKKVKCDETLPACGRCQRLNLACQQPASRVYSSRRDRVPGAGIWQKRQDRPESPRNLLPAPVVHAQQSLSDEYFTEPEPLQELALPHLQLDAGIFQPPRISSGLPQRSSITEINIIDNDNRWLFPQSQNADTWFRWDTQSHYVQPVASVPNPIYQHTGANENEASIEEQAVMHFATIFSLSQTTRDPPWSVPSLLLKHAQTASPMLHHLILAVSLFDLDLAFPSLSRSDVRQVALTHYQNGTEKFIHELQHGDSSDNVGSLGSFYCIYSFMVRQRLIDVAKLNRLSRSALEYLQKNNLDRVIPAQNLTYSASQNPNVDQKRAEQSLLARLIMWLIKLDAQYAFFGCNACLIGYYEQRPELLDGIESASKLALQLNWGSEYPISQTIRDIESTMPIELMTDLLVMSYRIGNLVQNHDPSTTDTQQMLHEQLDALEVKHGPVFYYGASDMTLQPAMKINCATSATLFYATRIYLLRSTSSPFGAEGSSASQHALSQLLRYARSVCSDGVRQRVYEFQWSLFIAGLETNDPIHEEWLQSRIVDTRFSEVLKGLLVYKRAHHGLVPLHTVRQTLLGL
ncbi:hypothetical protein BP6252_12992 [Coleophoma cylindrospora]|uniref:Zn(2)-C6 fungal-type domain-containing protein n=1 Tax=Coleophoma cylindrospora TaxID=1849047 RepID=A0A3D8QDK1_9HELO|nr:hypothetical protein BP6252_12992 [Coleophoma cylindrospora]